MNVEMPDGTVIEGVPEGTTKAAVLAKWRGKTPVTPEEPKAPEKPLGTPLHALGEPLLAMGSGMLAKPISDVAGLAATGASALGLTGAPEPRLGADPSGFRREIQERMTYQPRTQAGEAFTQYNPLALLARAIGWGGDLAQKGVEQLPIPPTVKGPLGSGVKEAVQQAPGLLGAKGPAMGEAAAGPIRGMSREVMQSALKPGIEALRTGKADKAIDLLLSEGINVTKGGAEKLKGRVDVLNDRIGQLIENSPATIDKGKVASTLQEALTKFEKQVNATDDIRAIESAWDDFVNHPLLSGKQQIPVKFAQEMKTGTYRALGDKSYGELKGAQIEAQKTLARGLKEEIAKAVPEVRPLNAQESQLLNALSLVERRALMSANKNPVGLGWLSTRPESFLAFLADRSELFKSLVARMLNKTAQGVRSVGAVGQPIGMAASQLQPPPQ